LPIDPAEAAYLVTAAEPDQSATVNRERSDKSYSWYGNRFPLVVVKSDDSVSTPKKHAPLSILRNRQNLAHLTIVVSREGTKNRMPKFSISSKDNACTTN
jgi:hypothetical protein